MKNKILTFIIGVLVGAIITTGVFLIINNSKSNNGMQGGPRGDMQQMGTPPEKPDGDNGNGQGTPPSMPGENSNSTQNTNTTAE